jgi:hypothetical protein
VKSPTLSASTGTTEDKNQHDDGGDSKDIASQSGMAWYSKIFPFRLSLLKTAEPVNTSAKNLSTGLL